MDLIKTFQQSISNAENLEQLCDFFSHEILKFGFYAFTLGYAPLRKGKVDSSGSMLFSTLPEAFQEEYAQQNMNTFDPVFELMASRYIPFTKSSIEPLFEASPIKKEVTELANQHEVGDALMIPLTTAEHVRGVVLFCNNSLEEFNSRIENDGPLLHLMGVSMMARAEELGFGQPKNNDTLLTNRECECLQLHALGKTNNEIATALGIAERTVRFHVSNACEKLGTTRRSRAITLAVQQGLIRI